MRQQFGIQCNFCGDVIYSNSPNDRVDCRCGMYVVSGGFDHEFEGVGFQIAEPTYVNRMVERKGMPYRYRDEKR